MCDVTPDDSVTYAASLASPTDARTYVRQHGCPAHAAIALDALLLIASELVTNAVRYGRPPIVLRLSCLVSEVRLSVADAGPGLPLEQGRRPRLGETEPRLPPEQGTCGGLGLGLLIVAKVAREWGTAPLANGKEIWCRVPTGMVQTDPAGSWATSSTAASPTGRSMARLRDGHQEERGQ